MAAAIRTRNGKHVRRLDDQLLALGLCTDAHQAQALILAGRVMVGEQKGLKPGQTVPLDAQLRLIGDALPAYVSRGGVKLAGALQKLQVPVTGLHCLDIGAATGGFTDCLLQHGAAHVVAVDVGYNLLHDKLRKDPRVTVFEKTHVRTLEPKQLPYLAELLVLDLSFIGVRQVLPALVPLVAPGGSLLLMIKPQFELPRSQVPNGGVVVDDQKRWQSVADVLQVAESLGLVKKAQVDSELPGPAGNREIFLWLHRPVLQRAPVPSDPWH